MNGDPRLYEILKKLDIYFDYYEHPPAPTIAEAKIYWKDLNATHCKNLFFRNHKGDKYYLVILDHIQQLDIHDLEKRLKQGKISFASAERLEKYLKIKPGSVSPFGLINDDQKHVRLFFDSNLQKSTKISFHPNVNTASIVVQFSDFMKFINWSGNCYEFLPLYDE
jgi:Ala-tRNA(Pro) deacylase